jgi:GntR family transcriptional regulator
MQIQIDPSSRVPIYLQIVNQVKYLIASGYLDPGQELPAIRRLAEALEVNANTVSRAYEELATLRLVVIRQGAGSYVSRQSPGLNRNHRHKILSDRIDALLTESQQLGIDLEEVLKLLRIRYQKMIGPE